MWADVNALPRRGVSGRAQNRVIEHLGASECPPETRPYATLLPVGKDRVPGGEVFLVFLGAKATRADRERVAAALSASKLFDRVHVERPRSGPQL